MKTFREKYNELIEFRKNNPPEVGEYTEKHHIIPRSIAPELINDKDNIVSLTGAEHFIAHYYLAQALKEEGNNAHARKMLYALTMMKKRVLKNTILTDEELNAIGKIYEKSKKALHEIGRSDEVKLKISETLKGHQVSSETRKKLSEFNKGERHPNYGKHLSSETKRKIGEKSRGRKHTDEAKCKMSEANRGKHLSSETRRKLSKSLIGNTRSLGMHWYNNGKESLTAFECPEGFVKGRLKKNK